MRGRGSGIPPHVRLRSRVPRSSVRHKRVRVGRYRGRGRDVGIVVFGSDDVAHRSVEGLLDQLLEQRLCNECHRMYDPCKTDRYLCGFDSRRIRSDVRGKTPDLDRYATSVEPRSRVVYTGLFPCQLLKSSPIVGQGYLTKRHTVPVQGRVSILDVEIASRAVVNSLAPNILVSLLATLSSCSHRLTLAAHYSSRQLCIGTRPPSFNLPASVKLAILRCNSLTIEFQRCRRVATNGSGCCACNFVANSLAGVYSLEHVEPLVVLER